MKIPASPARLWTRLLVHGLLAKTDLPHPRWPSRPRVAHVRGRLDSIDWAILKELQADGSITNVELARRVGLVRAALPAAGAGPGERRDHQGLPGDPRPEGARLRDRLLRHGAARGAGPEGALRLSRQEVKDWPMVRECWTLSGDIDFILKCVAPNLAAFQGSRRRPHRAAERAQRPHCADPRPRQGRAARPRATRRVSRRLSFPGAGHGDLRRALRGHPPAPAGIFWPRSAR